MSEWRQFLWLSEQAWEFILWPPLSICSIVLGIVITGTCIKQRPFKTGLWRDSYWFVFTQLFFYPTVIAVAVLGGVHFRPDAVPNKVALLYTDILFWASISLALFWVWRMKGLRLLAFSLTMLQELLLLGAFFVAGMAISGSWL